MWPTFNRYSSIIGFVVGPECRSLTSCATPGGTLMVQPYRDKGSNTYFSSSRCVFQRPAPSIVYAHTAQGSDVFVRHENQTISVRARAEGLQAAPFRMLIIGPVFSFAVNDPTATTPLPVVDPLHRF